MNTNRVLEIVVLTTLIVLMLAMVAIGVSEIWRAL